MNNCADRGTEQGVHHVSILFSPPGEIGTANPCMENEIEIFSSRTCAAPKLPLVSTLIRFGPAGWAVPVHPYQVVCVWMDVPVWDSSAIEGIVC